MVKRIISSFLISVILFSSCIVSSHTDLLDSGSYVVSNFWDFLQGNEFDYNLKFWNNVIGYFVGKECLSSPDSYHHGPKPAFGTATGGIDENGRYTWITCDYCHKQFKAYSSFSSGHGGGFSSDLQQSYDTQFSELPASICNSSGALSWIIVPDYYVCNERVFVPEINSGYISVHCVLDASVVDDMSFGLNSYYYAPISSFYTVSVVTTSADRLYPKLTPNINNLYFKSGAIMISNGSFLSVYAPSHSLRGFWNGYCLVSCVPTDSYGDTYTINSRPTSITGDYGIIGDNGQITKVNSSTIVNEDNSTVYNPVTGETHTMSDWSYNYVDRSYTVTTTTGDTITITYGDENITIKEGDITYNVYYIIEGSGSGETPDPGPGTNPDVCDHLWTETGHTDAACTTAGKVTYQCSKCGQTKTETIPATGHTWAVDRTVQTTYDEEGNLLQQGYTIYSCSVCGEQYKDMEGVGPPGDGEDKSIWEKLGDLIGTGFKGIIEIIEAILSKILDALISLLDMLMGKLKDVVTSILSIFDVLPTLFGGFLAFLSAVFPYLPEELMIILTFGIIAIVIIGIIKAVRR